MPTTTAPVKVSHKMKTKNSSNRTETWSAQECAQWTKVPDVNPRTGRKIKVGSATGIYASLDRHCGRERTAASAHQKYCRCLMKVRAASDISPYGICTASVLSKHGLYSARKPCDYKYEEFTYDQLMAYARELQARKRNPLGKLSLKAMRGDKAALVASLYARDTGQK